MLSHSHFIEFNDVKNKHFSNVLRATSLYVISCTRQSVALLTGEGAGIKISTTPWQAKCKKQAYALLIFQ